MSDISDYENEDFDNIEIVEEDDKVCKCKKHKNKENCSCEHRNCEDDDCECGCHDEECECKCKDEECECKHNEEECHCECRDEKISDSTLLANQYLNLAKQVQADFDNFRRHANEDIKQAKVSGQLSVIETFLPCLDTFKEAKKSITDENVLKGVEMIENKIYEALKSLGVEKVDSIGQVYNPHLHNVIAVMNDQEKDNDIILEEYQAGYKFNDKVIRYAKVIVNKKEDK